jgi:hypothetical protein
MVVSCLACLTLKMRAIFSSDTSVDFQRTARHYVPEDRTVNNYRCENLILHMFIVLDTTLKFCVEEGRISLWSRPFHYNTSFTRRLKLRRMLYSGMWRRVILCEPTIRRTVWSASHLITLVPPSRIFLHWRWRWYVSPKRRFTQYLTTPHRRTQLSS